MNVLKKLLPLAVVSLLAAALSTGCKPKSEPDNPATKTTVSLNKSAVDLTVGTSVTLTATLKPADAKEAVTWKSADPSIATVTNGQVKALKVGSTTITASIKSGASAKCTVAVKEAATPAPAKTTIALDKKEASVDLGQTLTLKSTLTPADAKDEITWSSSDDKVATVKDGVVTPVAKGKTTIKASLKNGEAAECDVSVTQPELPKAGTIKAKSDPIEVIKGEKNDILKLVDLIQPLQKTADGKDATLVLKEIKTIDPEKGEMTMLIVNGTTFSGESIGTTKLSITRTDNNETIEVKVVIKNKEFTLPEGAHIVVTNNGKEVTGVKLMTELGFELEAKLLDGNGKEISGVEILRGLSSDILGSDFTNANKITTNDEGKAKVIYSVAGTDVKTEIEVDSSYDYKGLTYIYKK